MPIIDPNKRNEPQAPVSCIEVFVHHPDWRFILSASFPFSDRTDVMTFAQQVSKDIKGKVNVSHNGEYIRRYDKGRRKRKL